jgi:hypothetical protein
LRTRTECGGLKGDYSAELEKIHQRCTLWKGRPRVARVANSSTIA